MAAFYIEFNNNKEAFDEQNLKDRIKNKYEQIRTKVPSYSDMKYEVDAYNDGCYFILPPDSD